MHKKSIFFTTSSNQTKKVGKILAKEVLKTRSEKKALVVGLIGDLGGGKTTFLQGFARGLGLKEKILSPTFIILRKFQIPNPKSQTNSKFQIPKFKTFYHADCYRVEKPQELLVLGYQEIISNPENIVAVEWADKILDLLPQDAIILKFDFINQNQRRIKYTLKK